MEKGIEISGVLSNSVCQFEGVSFDGHDFESKISETSPHQTDQVEFSISVVIDRGCHTNIESLHQFGRIQDNGQLPNNAASKGFFQFTIESIKDTTIHLLLCCATLSLVLGIKKDGLEDGWYDGACIFLAVFIVVVITALINFYQSRKFQKLPTNKNITVDVMREAKLQQISLLDIVVGDIVSLKTGDRVPADGVFIDGNSLKLDDEQFEERVDRRESPSMVTGAKVIDGYCTMLVTSVGENTAWAKMMRSVRCDSDENTQLKTELDKLNSSVEKIGQCFALLLLVVLLLRCFAGKTGDDENGDPDLKGKKTVIREFMNEATRIIKKQGGTVNVLVTTLTVLLLGIQEGLPLGVTLLLAYSAKRMVSDVAVLVNKLSACATIGSATTICIDKTGCLNSKMIAHFWIGQEDIMEDAPGVAQNLLQTLHEGVGLNVSDHAQEAVLCCAQRGLGMDMEKLKRSCTILHTQPFDFEKKRCGFSVRRREDVDKIIHVHWRGAPEILLPMCSDYYSKDGVMKSIDEHKKKELEQIIEVLEADSLQCIAFAHKQLVEEEDEAEAPKLKEDCLTLLAIIGFKYTCVPEMRLGVETCREVGVNIKFVSEDDVNTARFKAVQYQILRPDEDINGAVIEAHEFRNCSDEERREMVDKIRIMPNSSPSDKLLMVQCLRQKGEVVAVTGVSTRDSPSLKEADIGLSMGNRSSEAAKENSDIIILDEKLYTVATLLWWGRCVYNSIQKFIQLHLTINVSGIAINFIAAVSSGEAPLAPIQLWWVNLTMGILGALALAAEPPARNQMQRATVRRVDRLTTKAMWRNILVQALYQITVLLTLHFKGEAILGVSQKVKKAIIFNSYFFCEVFVLFNARELERKNVFNKIHHNRWFMGMMGIAVVLQLVFIEFAAGFADSGKLDLEKWFACIGIGAMSLPVGWAAKWIPVSV